ncbi:MAG: type II secretion system protein GspK [Colwellia sp.]|nr:type II secretion system protein GspK [Colwellia sp.]
MTQTAKNQVTQAQWGNDKIQAQVNVHSAESLLLFQLLTTKKNYTQSQSSESEYSLTDVWNFYATPFIINKNVTAQIQDQSSLIQLQYPDAELLQKLLINFGETANNAEVLVDSLLDWQDIDNIQRQNGAEFTAYGGVGNIRNGAIPSIYDIKYLKSLSPTTFQRLLPNVTIHKFGTFSALNAPVDILNAITNKAAVEQVMALRAENSLTRHNFKEATGIREDEDTYFYTSNYLKIKLISNVGLSKASKTMFIELNPYAEGVNRPVNIFINRG